jgi:hypothetical protein
MQAISAGKLTLRPALTAPQQEKISDRQLFVCGGPVFTVIVVSKMCD